MFSVAQQKKQEEKNLQKVRDLLRLPANKKCFDCPTKSPFFVNVSVQTFICSRCSGLVREVGHRVKSISASKFSGAEVVTLQQGGNEVARAIWLSNYGKDNVDPETDDEVRAFIRQKYYEQKWLDQEELKAHTNRVREMIKAMFTEEGIRRPGAKTPPLPGDGNAILAPPKRQQQRPASLQLTSSSWKSANGNNTTSSSLLDDGDNVYEPPMSAREVRSSGVTPFSPAIASPVPVTPSRIARDTAAPTTPTYVAYSQQQPFPTSPARPTPPVASINNTTTNAASTTTTPTSSIFSELAGLDISSKPARRATYTGGILTPATPGAASPTRSTPYSSIIGGLSSDSFKTTQPQSSTFSPLSPTHHHHHHQRHQSHSSSISSPITSTTAPPPQSPPIENDPYAALRSLSISSTKEEPPKQQEMIPDGVHERQDSEDTAWTEFSTSTTTIDDFGDFASEPLDAPPPPTKPDIAPPPKPVNYFGDLDPIAQFKRSGR
ncbi:hypothetical protein O0I10_010506 [Lichtheimia ornata]|uniref:Arf-GAP domain-containing protein n=1 Tax=Lichtheimia ornata TaxID=688661 RepID=A0AAD7XTG7_9FUNG|nr:uncharacterized protein O0I10_010506 [Lichtheimia ornata]KAJ8653825.1 hypothetical protein O0I10_010506 [Lichtheimia ornata]